MKNQWLVLTVVLISSLYGVQSNAEDKVFPGATLTPVGAELKGSKDNVIPPWQGTAKHQATFPEEIMAEKPLFEINAENLAEYNDVLPLGLSELVQRYPETMRIPVYKSHRPAYYPDWIYESIKKNHSSAMLADEGNSVTDTYSGIPFPVPTTGYQVLWNHLLSYRGVYVNIRAWEAVVHEKRKYSIIKSDIKYAMEYYRKGREISGLDQVYMYYLSSVTYPSKLSGGGLLVHERVNGSRIPRQGWGYMAGQRRVIRIPSVDYDSPMPRSEGIRFADEVDLYNGSVNRYHWRLIGKKELIIPYNNETLYHSLEKFDDINKTLLTPLHINPDFLRYEKHRVWIIEGVLKSGSLHPYKKRVLYLDEDSWLAVIAENYNKANDLWRISTSYVRQYETLPAVFKVVDVFHDLRDRVYYAQGIENDEVTDISQEMPPKAMFKPTALRRLGRR